MKKTMLSLSALALGMAVLAPTLRAQETEAGFTSLFNGKDLTGWEGRTNHWTVEDGVISGSTSKENPAKGNNFLIWRPDGKNGIVKDFVLRFSYKFSGDWGNSGLQYRSDDKGNFVVHGYQADFEVGPTYSGILYEEGKRGILCNRGKKVLITNDPNKPGQSKVEEVGSVGDTKEIQAAIKKDGWNEYEIVVQGGHLQHFINGKATADVTDESSVGAKQGIMAFQLHAGPAMKIQFKNVRLKTL